MNSLNSKSSIPKLPILIGLIVLLAAAGTVTALELTNTTYIFHKRHYVTGGPATKGQLPNGSQQAPSQSSQTPPTSGTSSDGTTKNPSPNTTTAALVAPSGIFISAHHQSLSMNPPINSVCNTTPGATCVILFTQGSVTKSLPAQTTDQGGATYWSGWHLQDIGITTGTWQVTAKATLGSQTLTASDSQDLEVSE